MVVLPSMDDQLLPLFRDWVIDVMYVFLEYFFNRKMFYFFNFSGEIASKPANPLIDSYKSQTSFRDKLQEYKDIKDLNRAGSSSPEKSKSNRGASLSQTNEQPEEEMTEL